MYIYLVSLRFCICSIFRITGAHARWDNHARIAINFKLFCGRPITKPSHALIRVLRLWRNGYVFPTTRFTDLCIRSNTPFYVARYQTLWICSYLCPLSQVHQRRRSRVPRHQEIAKWEKFGTASFQVRGIATLKLFLIPKHGVNLEETYY